MFLTDGFLKYGRPMAAAAPIMLGLIGLPATAHACTGSADDPAHCINNGQVINGFGDFFVRNLEGVPGTTSVPGSTSAPGETQDDFGQLLLTGLAGLGGHSNNAIGFLTARSTVTEGGSESTEDGDGQRVGVRLSGYGRFGLNYLGSGTTGTSETNITSRLRLRFDMSAETDNGLVFGSRIRLQEDGDSSEIVQDTPSFNIRFGGLIDEGALIGNGDSSAAPHVRDAFSAIDTRPDEEIQFNPSITLDNGLKIGADIQLESTGDDIDESFLFIRGSFGEILIGDDQPSGGRISTGSPENDDFVYRPQITMDNGLTFAVNLDSGVGAAATIPEGSDTPRITYFTPRFAGFQLGVNYDREGGATNFGPTDISRADGREFDIGNSYVNSFGGFSPALSERWGGLGATLNYAVGSASLDGYGSLEDVNIEKFNYIPIDDGGLGSEFGLQVQYDLGGGVSVKIPINDPSANRVQTSAPPPTSLPNPRPFPVQAPVTGEQIGELAFNNQGTRTNLNVIRTSDGEIHGVDAETGHDYGKMHESSSGFGWSFDGTPIQPPAAGTTPTPNPISALDADTVFTDGFESGNVQAWSYVRPSF